MIEVDTAGPVDRFAVLERVLVDGDAAAQGVSLGARTLEPVNEMEDGSLLVGTAARWVRTLRNGGHTPEPFGIVLTLRGVPELVAPSNWLSGPPDWTMGWGDAEPDELVWVRGALEHTHVRHRAAAAVTIDGGVVRVEVRHRADGSVQILEVAF